MKLYITNIDTVCACESYTFMCVTWNVHKLREYCTRVVCAHMRAPALPSVVPH